MRKFPKTLKKGDRLLRSSADDRLMTAMFAPDPTMREVCLWHGYMKAGAALIDEAQRQPLHRNLLLYPILFNYRHGLETGMKWIIGNVEPDERGHDLLALWRKCRTIFESVPEFDGDEELEAVEQIVKEFHDIDKTATSFRYSRNQNGAAIPLPDKKSIGLQNVRDVMEGMDNFFHKAFDIVFAQTEEGSS
jgi:hypothetical protein